MKLNKMIIISLSILAILIFTFIIYTFLSNYMIPNIPDDENLQVSVLEEIYRDFLDGQELNNCTIAIDESALLNLITNEKFSDSGIEELKDITKRYKGYTITSKKYVLSSTYSNGVLKLKLFEQPRGLSSFDLYECTSTYKLINYDDKLSYTKKGEDIITYRESPYKDVWY